MRKEVISEVLLRTLKAALSPPEIGALSLLHVFSSLPGVLPGWLHLADGWGWSPGERLWLPSGLPALFGFGDRGQMANVWIWVLAPQ